MLHDVSSYFLAPCLVGLILAYGIIVIIGGTTDLSAASFGIDNASDIGGSDGMFPPIVLLLAQLTVTMFGLVSVFLGFQVCVGLCFYPEKRGESNREKT